VHPNSSAISKRWEAVHVTLRAIAAVQGIYFMTLLGPTPAPYWHVECAFRLNWCFTTLRFIRQDSVVQLSSAPT
jgi:hypothetical protein